MSRLAEAIETAKIDLVPRVVVGGGQGQGGQVGNVLEGLLAMLMAHQTDEPAPTSPLASSAARPEIARLRDEVLASATRSSAARDRVEARASSASPAI